MGDLSLSLIGGIVRAQRSSLNATVTCELVRGTVVHLALLFLARQQQGSELFLSWKQTPRKPAHRPGSLCALSRAGRLLKASPASSAIMALPIIMHGGSARSSRKESRRATGQVDSSLPSAHTVFHRVDLFPVLRAVLTCQDDHHLRAP